MIVDNLTLMKRLGKGSFGEVFLTSKKGSTELFATKKMDRKYADSPAVRKYFINEISILKEISHPNIVRLDQLKQTKDHYYIVMEYCNGGSLTECLANYKKLYGKPFTEEIVQYLMRQIVDAIKYLHNRKIIHRDLKLDNILVKFNNEVDKAKANMMKAQVKVIDFGFAIHLNSKNMAFSALGSPINMDPIILKKLNKKGGTNALGYDEKADIWSLGTICYEMLIGQAVFSAESMNDLVKKVECGTYYVPTSLSKEVVSFMNGMLQYDSKLRFSASELAKHHFLTKKVSDFTPIDLGKGTGRPNPKDMNLNTKRSIWGVFNEENEKKLMNIPQNLNQQNAMAKTPNHNQIRRGRIKTANTDKLRKAKTQAQPEYPNFNTFNNPYYPTFNGFNQGFTGMFPNSPNPWSPQLKPRNMTGNGTDIFSGQFFDDNLHYGFGKQRGVNPHKPAYNSYTINITEEDVDDSICLVF